MFFQESETIELKEIVMEDIKKEIIAFANSKGGTLYIGVRKDGTVIGVENPDSVALQISNMVRDAIKPDLTMFLHYETLEEDGKKIVSIDIQQGTERPYYIAKKGLRPEGVYIRQGYSSAPATASAIRRMIKETDGERFEEMRSLEQELTFQATAKEFKRRSIDFGPQQMQTLKLLNHDGIFTNLGLLLSEQCVHTIKAAVFQDTAQSIFKDRHEFTGSLMQQLNEVYDFIDFHNQIHATFDKLLRVDTRDYPEVAVREALLNLLVHRDYTFRASSLISIYSDRIEFISIGGLLPGIDLEDVMIGLSVCRNQNLTNVFYRLQLIEAYGIGLSKIMKAYENSAKKPMIENTNNAFKITLPNINIQSDLKETTVPKAAYTLTRDEITVLDYVKTHGFVTRIEVEKQFQVSASTASRLLRYMVAKDMLVQHGKGKSIKYGLPK